MDSNTKAELIQSGVTALGAIGKELFVRRKDREMMEREAEIQKELATLRAGGKSNKAPENDDDSAVSALDEAASLADQYESLLARAEAEEDCELCRSLISSARELPLDKQQRVIPQLRDFLSTVEDDASRDELVSEINDSPELKSLMQRHMDAVGGDSSTSSGSRTRGSAPETSAAGRQQTLY